MNSNESDKIFQALEMLRIELPSWGFANTGTRFGKFIQAAAATTVEEKFSDAAQVHRLTGTCPSMALHIQWDFPVVRYFQIRAPLLLFPSWHALLYSA